MGSDQKHGDSETSSDQETSGVLSPISSKEGLGRSYECTFCKRGFTNAQALGGHMNIHRKDKAKAKQHTTGPVKPNKDHLKSSFNHATNEEARYLGSFFGCGTGDHGYQFMPSNPSYHEWALAASQYDNRVVHHDEDLRVNLNLGIGTSDNCNMESTEVGNEDWIENGVDLELRLGQYP